MSRRVYKKAERVIEPVPGGTPVEHVPELGDDKIPKERYRTLGYMDLEWEHLWTRIWLMGGLASNLAGHFEPDHAERMTLIRDLTVESDCNGKTRS